MAVAPQVFFGTVMHNRLFPRRNRFSYGIYYLALPLGSRSKLPIAHNRFAALSFYDRDHGPCDGSDLQAWARSILADYAITAADGLITLVCMPRVFGYVFNPVSFWLCHDRAGQLRAVLCEVNNTFGERHTYLCAHADQRPLTAQVPLQAEKLFHVSPLLKREGHYRFRFAVSATKLDIHIDFYTAENRKQLVTALSGQLEPMHAASLRKAFWRYPLMTFKAISLIHWQALKLLAKGLTYIARPPQKPARVSATKSFKLKPPKPLK